VPRGSSKTEAAKSRPRPRPRQEGSRLRPRPRQWKLRLEARQCLEAPHHWVLYYVYSRTTSNQWLPEGGKCQGRPSGSWKKADLKAVKLSWRGAKRVASAHHLWWRKLVTQCRNGRQKLTCIQHVLSSVVNDSVGDELNDVSVIVKWCDLSLLQSIELSSKIAAQRKAVLELCAKARNDYSRHQIRRDFRAGMKVICDLCCWLNMLMFFQRIVFIATVYITTLQSAYTVA